MTVQLRAQALSRAAFAAFGEVVDTEGAHHYTINAGWAERYHDLAALDVSTAPGRPALSIFRATPRPLPVALTLMERHKLSSQTFMPLSAEPFLVVVAPAGAAPAAPNGLSVFISNGRQGVSYRRGVWHHPLLAINAVCDFLVIDRIAPEEDCDEVSIEEWSAQIVVP